MALFCLDPVLSIRILTEQKVIAVVLVYVFRKCIGDAKRSSNCLIMTGALTIQPVLGSQHIGMSSVDLNAVVKRKSEVYILYNM